MLFSFFKDSLKKRAETLILELNEAFVYTLVKFEYQSSSSKNDESLKKTNRILCIFVIK